MNGRFYSHDDQRDFEAQVQQRTEKSQQRTRHQEGYQQ
jgi:hypothetical protein